MKQVLIIISILNISIVSFSQNEIDLFMLNKNFDEALLQIDVQMGQNPTSQLYFKKGLIYNNQQSYELARLAFEEAFKLDSTNAEICIELADCHATLGNYYDANRFFGEALNLQPENISLLAKLGRNFISLKDYKHADSCFSVIYVKDSTNVFWNKQLAFCAAKTNQKKRAIYLYNKVLQQNYRDYSSYFNLIHLYDKKEEDSLILATIEKGLLNFPGNQEFFAERANLYYFLKNYESAKFDYENYFSLGGDSIFPVLSNYGVCTYFAKDELQAVKILEMCVAQAVNDPTVLFFLSLSYKNLKNFETSEAYMKAAIEAATPAYLPDFYHHLGLILGQQRKYKESITVLQKAYELDPENVEILFEIATTYEEFNPDKMLALDYYRMYLQKADDKGKNATYSQNRINKIKEDLFFKK